MLVKNVDNWVVDFWSFLLKIIMLNGNNGRVNYIGFKFDYMWKIWEGNRIIIYCWCW